MKRQKWMLHLQMLATMIVALIALFSGARRGPGISWSLSRPSS